MDAVSMNIEDAPVILTASLASAAQSRGYTNAELMYRPFSSANHSSVLWQASQLSLLGGVSHDSYAFLSLKLNKREKEH